MSLSNNQNAFFELVRAGLWEKEFRLLPFDKVDCFEVMQLAENQSVVGLVTTGLENVKDVKIPHEVLLQFIGLSIQIEQRNLLMNEFISKLITRLRNQDVYTLLVKGQGIAQCYERPLWRASGDVDLFLSDNNYAKAKEILTPLANSIEPEDHYEKHLGMNIMGWSVELHGNLRTGLSLRIDNQIDEEQRKVFYGGEVRSWMNGDTQVFLPGINCDVFFVFTHILKHFFKDGIGLRQICDWCRLMWYYREKIDVESLEIRLKKAGLNSEWKAFASLAVEWLGMPVEAMPLYTPSSRWKRKAKKIIDLILETGNFGHNRDDSYYVKYPFLIRKTISFWRYTKDSLRHLSIFPLDASKAWFHIVCKGLFIAAKGR